MIKCKLLPQLRPPLPHLPPLPALGSAPRKEPLRACLSCSTEGSNTVPRPGVPAPGPHGAPGEAAGARQRSEPEKDTGTLGRSPGRRWGRSPASAAGQRSGAGRPLLTAPFGQAYPASFPPPPAGAPGQRSPATLTSSSRGVTAATAVIAASAVRSRATAARGGRARARPIAAGRRRGWTSPQPHYEPQRARRPSGSGCRGPCAQSFLGFVVPRLRGESRGPACPRSPGNLLSRWPGPRGLRRLSTGHDRGRAGCAFPLELPCAFGQDENRRRRTGRQRNVPKGIREMTEEAERPLTVLACLTRAARALPTAGRGRAG